MAWSVTITICNWFSLRLLAPSLRSRSLNFPFANMTGTATGNLLAPLELIESGLPTSWWRSSVRLDLCYISTKALFATPGNYTDNRFHSLSWTVEYDPTPLLQSTTLEGTQTYAYDTSYTYSSVFNSDGRAVVVETGGTPPPEPPTSGAAAATATPELRSLLSLTSRSLLVVIATLCMVW